MVTSLTLAFFSQQQVKSVVEKPVVEQPAEPDNLPAADGQGGFDPSRLKEGSSDGLPAAN